MITRYLLTIWLTLLVALAAQAQCIRATDAAGNALSTLCVNQPVTFSDCGDEIDDNKEYYVFDYKGEADFVSIATLNKTHTYTAPGRYKVLQVANYGGTIGTDTVSQVYEVKAAPSPTFTFTSCLDREVRFTVTDTNYDSYTLDFGDGQTATLTAGASTSHTYTAAGSYTATLTGTYTEASCTNSSSQTVNTLPPLDGPNVQLVSLRVQQQGSSGSLLLELANLVQGYNYVVERFTGDFRNPYEEVATISSFSGSTLTYTVPNVNTEEATWYLVRPQDPCNNNLLNSNVVSSVSLALSTNEEQVTLDWETLMSQDFEQFEIYRNGSLLVTKGGTDRTYLDTDVTCGQTYTFSVVGLNTDPEGDSFTSASAELQVSVSSTRAPAQPFLLTSYTLTNELVLQLETEDPASIASAVFSKSGTGGSFQEWQRTNGISYTSGEAPQQACYQATVTNTCGNTSPVSNISCPMLLTAERQADGSVLLNWTAYQGFAGGVQGYTVELLDADGNTVASSPVTGTTYTDRALSTTLQQLRYRISATNGTYVTYSNAETINQNALLYLPSAFTPNNDGLNDTFEVKGKFFSGYTLLVYNRLGSVVYEGTEADAPWDGTHNGARLPAGAYAYQLTVQTDFGTSQTKTGTITLLR